jgi:hypothetical protein
MKKPLSRFLIERPRAHPVPRDSHQVDVQVLDAEILGLAEHARACISSPLVRKAKACPRFAIGASTFSKKVAAGQMPPPAYKSRSITAYKEIDLDMMLAAQALATRNGFILNATAFVAALCAPVNATAEVIA